MPQGMKGERRRDINLYAKTEKKKKHKRARVKTEEEIGQAQHNASKPFFFFCCTYEVHKQSNKEGEKRNGSRKKQHRKRFKHQRLV